MKASELTKEQLLALGDAEQEKIIYCDMEDDGGKGEFALLLGGDPAVMPYRCRAAADLYLAGRVMYIIPSGGVSWPDMDCPETECERMTALLLEMGVPQEAIVPENEARTTKENMICGTLQMNRKMKLHQVHRVYIVTSQCHMRRALTYARIFLPSTVEAAPCHTVGCADDRENWQKTELGRQRARREMLLIKEQIDLGILSDIEI